MALVAHRMMLPARHRRSTQQVARNKVGVLLVPSVADYYGGDVAPPLPPPAVSQQQLNLQPDPPQPAVDGNGSGKLVTGNQPICLEPSVIAQTTMLTVQSGHSFVAAAYVEIGSYGQVHLVNTDPVLANTAGGQVTEIIKQAAKEYEMVKLKRFLRKRSPDANIGDQAALK